MLHPSNAGRISKPPVATCCHCRPRIAPRMFRGGLQAVPESTRMLHPKAISRTKVFSASLLRRCASNFPAGCCRGIPGETPVLKNERSTFFQVNLVEVAENRWRFFTFAPHVVRHPSLFHARVPTSMFPWRFFIRSLTNATDFARGGRRNGGDVRQRF